MQSSRPGLKSPLQTSTKPEMSVLSAPAAIYYIHAFVFRRVKAVKASSCKNFRTICMHVSSLLVQHVRKVLLVATFSLLAMSFALTTIIVQLCMFYVGTVQKVSLNCMSLSLVFAGFNAKVCQRRCAGFAGKARKSITEATLTCVTGSSGWH